jgi:hypothetical protein
MSFKTIETTIGSAVATSGTVTFAYPANTNAGSFAAFGHKIWVDKFQKLLSSPSDFTVSFGASNITVTYKAATSIPTGARLNAQFNVLGEDDENLDNDFTGDDPLNVAPANVVNVSLGAPDAADPNGVAESQSGAAGALTIDGALASGGVATLDVPRNLVVDSGGADTATLTITGTDAYGSVLVEEITLNGTTAVPGKKAFKTVTSIVSDATISNGAFVGTGDVLGLPVFLPGTAYVLAELEDGAAPTDGTLVAGVSTTPSATTGDVRGTYDPNSAADGAKVFDLLVALPDPKYKGVAQYAG